MIRNENGGSSYIIYSNEGGIVMASFKFSFWKIFTAMGVFSQWLEDSVDPESEGGTSITVNECADLVKRMILAMGWDVVIVDPSKEVLGG